MGNICAVKTWFWLKTKLVKLLKTLYGLPDGGDYWYDTMTWHLISELNMKQINKDLVCFSKVVNLKLVGLIGTCVDDTIGAGNEMFE